MQSEVKKKFGLHDWKDFYHMNCLSHTRSQVPLGKSRPTPWKSAAIPSFSTMGIQADYKSVAQEIIYPKSTPLRPYSNYSILQINPLSFLKRLYCCKRSKCCIFNANERD